MNGIPNDPKEFLERVNKISPGFEITGNYTKLSETYLHCKCKKCGHERNYSAKTLLETQHCRYCERMKKYDKILNIYDEEFKKRVKSQYPNLNITGTYKPCLLYTSESKDYDLYVKRFKEVSDNIGHALCGNELMNNKYGLPNPIWFVKYCPDKNVKKYDDFVRWCGYESNKLKKEKEDIANALINLEKELGRPILREDISLEKTGFSMIVLVRMFGGLNKAKEEIGLMPVSYTHLDVYKRQALYDINSANLLKCFSENY